MASVCFQSPLKGLYVKEGPENDLGYMCGIKGFQ